MKFLDEPRPVSAVSTSLPPGTAGEEDLGDNDGLSSWRGNDQLELYKAFITPSTTAQFDEFLKQFRLSKRAKAKLRNLYTLTIHPLIVSGNIPTERDEAVLLAIFNRAVALLPDGLSGFDTRNPALHQVVTLMRLHFTVELQKARKGRTFDALTRTRQDVFNYEAGNVQPARRNFLQTFGILGGR
jgi:hypothetical protein